MLVVARVSDSVSVFRNSVSVFFWGKNSNFSVFSVFTIFRENVLCTQKSKEFTDAKLRTYTVWKNRENKSEYLTVQCEDDGSFAIIFIAQH